MPQPSPWRAHAPFYLCALAWNFGLGMTYPLIPLYADSLGMSGITIGTLISLPVILQIAFNLVGGAFTDRIGGRVLVLAACLLMGAGATAYARSSSFGMLLVAQMVMVMSRAMFWPATWTIASSLPGSRSVELGRLNSMTNLGQILGTFAAGLSIACVGFANSFLMLAGVGLTAFAIMLRHPRSPPAATPGPFAPMARYARLVRMRPMLFIIMCAYISALPFSLSVSFYPLLFESHGYSHEVNGLILCLRGIGAAVAGVLVARHLDFSMKGPVAVGSAISVAIAVGAVGLIDNLPAASLLMFLVGLGSGLMSLNFQVMIAEVSAAEDRGSANALGGLGWGLSHLTTPLLMGFLRDSLGIERAFVILSVVVFTWAGGLALLHRWAFRRA
jgi:predicted MFS family arabinose efflux permease